MLSCYIAIPLAIKYITIINISANDNYINGISL